MVTSRWKLEDAKARFSELVRRACEDGPQRVTARGQDAVVVMSVEEFERLIPQKPKVPFVQFMEGSRARGRSRPEHWTLKGWLLDTNVVAALINPQGAPPVKSWAAGQDEVTFHISILALAEYDKGIHNLRDDHPDRPRYAAGRDALAEQFGARVLSLSDEIARRWGGMSGEAKRATGQPPPVINSRSLQRRLSSRFISSSAM